MSRFLIPHNVQIYERFFRHDKDDYEDTRWLAGHILAHQLTELADRDVQNASARFKGNKHKKQRADMIQLLTDTNWLFPVKVVEPRKPGRPVADRWTINPKVHVLYRERGEYERQQRALARERITSSKETFDDQYGEEG
jgi:hypothetical protein